MATKTGIIVYPRGPEQSDFPVWLACGKVRVATQRGTPMRKAVFAVPDIKAALELVFAQHRLHDMPAVSAVFVTTDADTQEIIGEPEELDLAAMGLKKISQPAPTTQG